MSDWINIVPLILFVVIIVFLAYQVAILYKDKLDLIREIVQANTNIDLLSSRLAEVSDKASLMSGSQEDFVKFLSESRDTAFTYIDDVQLAIKDLKNATDAGNTEEISDAFNKLISFLPDDNGMVE